MRVAAFGWQKQAVNGRSKFTAKAVTYKLEINPKKPKHRSPKNIGRVDALNGFTIWRTRPRSRTVSKKYIASARPRDRRTVRGDGARSFKGAMIVKKLVGAAARLCVAFSFSLSASGQQTGDTAHSHDYCQPVTASPTSNGTPDNSFVGTMAQPAGSDGPSYTNYLCYASSSETWTEADALVGPTANTTFVRRFQFWRPPYSSGINVPLIIWAHPNLEYEIIQ